MSARASEDVDVHIGNMRVSSDGTVRRAQNVSNTEPSHTVSSQAVDDHDHQATYYHDAELDVGGRLGDGSESFDTDACSMDSVMQDYLDNISQDNMEVSQGFMNSFRARHIDEIFGCESFEDDDASQSLSPRCAQTTPASHSHPAARSTSEPPPGPPAHACTESPACPSSCQAPLSAMPRSGHASDWLSSEMFALASACRQSREQGLRPSANSRSQSIPSHMVTTASLAMADAHSGATPPPDTDDAATATAKIKPPIKMSQLKGRISKGKKDRKKLQRKERRQERAGDVRLPALKPKNSFQGFNPLAISKALRHFVRDAAAADSAAQARSAEMWLRGCPEDVQRVCRPDASGGIIVLCGMLAEGAGWAGKAARLCGVSPEMSVLPDGSHALRMVRGPASGPSGRWRSVSCAEDGTLLAAPSAFMQQMIGQALRNVQSLRSAAEPTAAARGRTGRRGPPRAVSQKRGGGGAGPGARHGAMAAQVAEQPTAFVSGGVIRDARSDRMVIPAAARVGFASGAAGEAAGAAGGTIGDASVHGLSCMEDRAGVVPLQLGAAVDAAESAERLGQPCHACGDGESTAPAAGQLRPESSGADADMHEAAEVAGAGLGAAGRAAAVSPVAVAPEQEAREERPLSPPQRLGLGLGGGTGVNSCAAAAVDMAGRAADGRGASAEAQAAGPAQEVAADAVPLFELAFEGFMIGGGSNGVNDSPWAARSAMPGAPVRDGTEVEVTAEFASAYVPGCLPNDNSRLAKKARKKAAKESRRAVRRGHDSTGAESATGGLGSQLQHGQGNPGFGAFEQHTRGIGAKLLKQMGYQEGQGLGKDSQGMVDPIQPRRWQNRAGIGKHPPPPPPLAPLPSPAPSHHLCPHHPSCPIPAAPNPQPLPQHYGPPQPTAPPIIQQHFCYIIHPLPPPPPPLPCPPPANHLHSSTHAAHPQPTLGRSPSQPSLSDFTIQILNAPTPPSPTPAAAWPLAKQLSVAPSLSSQPSFRSTATIDNLDCHTNRGPQPTCSSPWDERPSERPWLGGRGASAARSNGCAQCGSATQWHPSMQMAVQARRAAHRHWSMMPARSGHAKRMATAGERKQDRLLKPATNTHKSRPQKASVKAPASRTKASGDVQKKAQVLQSMRKLSLSVAGAGSKTEDSESEGSAETKLPQSQETSCKPQPGTVLNEAMPALAAAITKTQRKRARSKRAAAAKKAQEALAKATPEEATGACRKGKAALVAAKQALAAASVPAFQAATVKDERAQFDDKTHGVYLKEDVKDECS
eukprot:jgi/Ulvmu1/10128/UM006_0081.1